MTQNKISTEPVVKCPLCGVFGEIRYSGLRDAIWDTPGEWAYRACPECKALWIDPRPLPRSFPAIYPEDYLTHFGPFDALCPRDGALETLRLGVKREILRRSWGYSSSNAPGSLAGFLGAAAAKIPQLRRWAGFTVRFLPAVNGGRLLDVGCATGGFLYTMSKLGWGATGVEPDPISASMGRKAGVEIFDGTTDTVSFPPDTFDGVTLHHVIEHLADPLGVVVKLASVLRPGGLFVSVSPNPDGFLARRFGGYWRGLEPPRHFILLGRLALGRIASSAGLSVDEIFTTARNADWMARESESIRRCGNIRDYKGGAANRAAAAMSRIVSLLGGDEGDEIVIIARKK
ncbi:MAG: class I SAM-dependent methyltransferase [Deltaproteobacteria bacterium]